MQTSETSGEIIISAKHSAAEAEQGGSKKTGKNTVQKAFDALMRRRTCPVFNYAALFLLSCGVGLTSLLLGAVVFGFPLFLTYLEYPSILLLNLLPPVLLTFFLYFISGRAWIAFSFPAAFTIFISIAHFIKVQFRGDPLVATDIFFIREGLIAGSGYSLDLNWKIIVALLVLITGVLISVFLLKYKISGKKFRIISSVAAAAVCVTLYSAVYLNDNIHERTGVDMELTEWSMSRDFISKGFLYPFINSIPDVINVIFPGRDLPDWYDEDIARELFAQFNDADIPPEKTVNIISIMLEAYTDLSRFDVLDFAVDVYAPFHRLQAESISGMLVCNVFGGLTIDTERLFLSGNTQLSPFSVPTNTFVHFLRSQGFYTEGFHAGDMWFYDRRPINMNLGFENFLFIDDFPDGNRTDSFFFPTVLYMYLSRDRSVPYFSYNLTYQNHGPYPSCVTQEPYMINRGSLSEESFNILNNYLTGIYDTNRHIEEFINALRHDPDPVVVVLFGDHKPWLGNGHSVYHELGINIDGTTDEGFLNFFSTPYIIWANYAAREVIGHDFIGQGRSFSPGFLMVEVFSLLNWEGESYMQAMRSVMETIDVIHAPLGKFRENGVITRELSPESDRLLRNLRMMEIYRRLNFFY